MTRQIWYSI